MQAIKYAAMASPFDTEVLADAYAEFLRRHGDRLFTGQEATDELLGHTGYTLSEELCVLPASCSWLGSSRPTSQQPPSGFRRWDWISRSLGVQAYQTPEGAVITVSQHYPPPEAEEFIVAPTRARRRSTSELPPVDWSGKDVVRLASEVRSETIRTTMDMCSLRPGEWVSSEEIRQATGREVAKHRGDYGGFGVTLRARFQRSNHPLDMQWAAGGTNEQYYRVQPEIARLWLAVTSAQGAPPAEESLDAIAVASVTDE